MAAALACFPGVALAADSKSNATIVYYDAVGNETLDPAEPQSGSSFSQEVLLALYDTLVRLDDAGNPTPGLAESWKASDDLTSFTLALRRGVKFHDGSELTAEVVKQNLQRYIVLGTKASGTMVESVKMIDAVEVTGPYEVKLVLKGPSGQLPYFLGGIAGMVAAPASLASDAFGVTFKAVGSGPYRLKSFESNVKTVMARNDEYWGGAQSRPAGFEHHYVPDGRARLNALRSGQANVVLIDPRQIPEAKSAGLTVQINEKNGVWDIYVNLSRAPLNDLKVRQAFMHAVDRAALAEALSFGSGKPTVQLFAQKLANLRPGARCPVSVRPEEGQGPAGRGWPQGRHRDHPAAAEHDRIQAARRGAAGDACGVRYKGEVRRGGRLPVQPVPPGAVPRRFPDGALGRTGGPAADVPGTDRHRGDL